MRAVAPDTTPPTVGPARIPAYTDAVIGPAFVLAVLCGIFTTALYALIRGSIGARLPLVILAAILGAWAGDSLGERLGIDLIRLGDFRVLAAFVGAWLGIGIVSVVAALGPQGRRV